MRRRGDEDGVEEVETDDEYIREDEEGAVRVDVEGVEFERRGGREGVERRPRPKKGEDRAGDSIPLV